MIHNKQKPLLDKSQQEKQNLRVITADNPSLMTNRGTNTYIIGNEIVAVIDPGPKCKRHLEALLKALDKKTVSHIIVTHSHPDHCGLAKLLAKEKSSSIYGFGLAYDLRSEAMKRFTFDKLNNERNLFENTFSPDNTLSDGQIIRGDDWTLEVLYTPGHLSNHICLCWKEMKAIFSGDHVMGWATSVICPPNGDMRQYINSLKIMINRQEKLYYPGHGDPISDGRKKSSSYLFHRNHREKQITKILSQRGPMSSIELGAEMYQGFTSSLAEVAQNNILSHLIDLTDRRLTEYKGTVSFNTYFSLIQK